MYKFSQFWVKFSLIYACLTPFSTLFSFNDGGKPEYQEKTTDHGYNSSFFKIWDQLKYSDLSLKHHQFCHNDINTWDSIVVIIIFQTVYILCRLVPQLLVLTIYCILCSPSDIGRFLMKICPVNGLMLKNVWAVGSPVILYWKLPCEKKRKRKLQYFFHRTKF